MGAPISVRLDDDVRITLEREATDRGIGLATYLRQLAAEAAREARRRQIREQSAQVGKHVAGHEGAAAFYDTWGAPPADLA